MKKLSAYALLCLGLFAVGCAGEEAEVEPAATPATPAVEGEAEAD